MSEQRAAVASLLSNHTDRTTAAFGGAAVATNASAGEAELQQAIAASLAEPQSAAVVDEEAQLAAAIAASLQETEAAVAEIDEAVALEDHNPMDDADDDDDAGGATIQEAIVPQPDVQPVLPTPAAQVPAHRPAPEQAVAATVVEEEVVEEAVEAEAEPSAEELRRLRLARFG